MKYIARISDCGPLSFRAGRDTKTSETLSYVPGSTLLGGLASAHGLLGRAPAEFTDFFMREESYFTNLYPVPSVPENARPELEDLQEETAPVYPIPVTARTCKRFGGFKFDQTDGDDPHHGVYDSLIPWAIFALSDKTSIGALEAEKYCLVPECNEPMDHFTGFYRRSDFNQEAIGKAKAKRGLRTRTGIDRNTGTVKHGILYSREVLRAGSQFWGIVNVPDEQAMAFYDFIEEANRVKLLRLGNNRTRGFGRITLGLEQSEQRETTETLRQRIDDFTAELRCRAREASIDAPHAAYVPLTLTSDVILYDRLLRCQMTITPAYLNEVWGLAGAELIYQNSGARRVMSWNSLWRLPKPDDIALAMGSVFLVAFQEPLNESRLQALLTMQNQGVGARRREGFGRLVVANPFHWEVKGL
jgi:CRISPR-associated protein Csx10